MNIGVVLHLLEYFYLDLPQIAIMDLVDNITTTPDMDSLNMAMSNRGGSEQPLLDLAVMKVEMDSYLIMIIFFVLCRWVFCSQ